MFFDSGFLKSGLVFILIFSIFISFSANKKVVTDMELTYYDSKFKYSYIYNDLAQPVVETKSVFVNGVWRNISQREWSYQFTIEPNITERKWKDNKWLDTCRIENSQNANVIEQVYLFLENSELVPVKKQRMTISNGRTTKLESLSMLNNNWLLESEVDYFFNSKAKTDSTIQSIHLNSDSIQKFKTIFLYYPNGELESTILQTSADSNKWENDSKSNFYYRNDKLFSLRNYSWNSHFSDWERKSRIDYFYDNSSNVTDEIYWKWNSIYWVQELKYSNLYDSNGRIVKKMVSSPIFRDWRNISTINYAADSTQSKLNITSVYGFWSHKSGESLNTHVSFVFNDQITVREASDITLTYGLFTGINAETNNNLNSKFKTYPNPSNGIFYINCSENRDFSWELYNIGGMLVRSSFSNYSASIIDLCSEPNGIYILKVKSENEVYSHKLIKQ